MSTASYPQKPGDVFNNHELKNSFKTFLFVLIIKRKLADLTDTSFSSGYIERLAENFIASIPPTGEVISAMTSGRTGCNMMTNNDRNKDQQKVHKRI